MKYYSLFFIILFIPEFGYSQDSIVSGKLQNHYSGFSVSLEGGLSSSFGLYHMDGLDEDGWLGGECASAGSSISINCNYRFQKYRLELTATVGYNHNNYDLSSFINEQGDLGNNTLSGIVSNTSATSYNTGYLLAGIKYPLYLGRFTFNFDVMAGFLICQTPSISFTERYLSGPVIYSNPIDTIPWSVSQPSETGFVVCINVGAGIEYNITKNIFVLISGNLGIALNAFNVTINSTEPTNIKNLPVDYYYGNLKIQINNLEMGVGYEF